MLVLAIGVLIVAIARLTGHLDILPITPPPTPSLTPSRTAPPPTSRPTRSVAEPDAAAALPLTATQGGPSSPADQWAGRVLDRILPLLDALPPLEPGTAWWQATGSGALLTVEGSDLLLGGHLLIPSQHVSIDLLIPSAAGSTPLRGQASVAREGEALVLTVLPPDPTADAIQWLLSNADPAQVLRMLVTQADSRGVTLIAAYAEPQTTQAELVLLGAVEAGVTPTPSPTVQTPGPTPTATRTPTATATGTPTRVPEAFYGEVIAGVIDPFIDAADEIDADTALAFAQDHPWTGLLTWAEEGPAVGGRALPVREADDLLIDALAPDDPTGGTELLLALEYNGHFTRLVDKQVVVYDRRMDEALYWMVRRAADRGGQLYVAFDDFGARQVLTVIDFRPFSTQDR